jgi:PmbA protein
MNEQEKTRLAHWVIEKARAAGADNAEVNIRTNRSIEVNCREKMLEKLRESTKNSLSLSVYANGRYSSHSTNDLRREALKTFIAEAVAMTGYLSEDKYRTLPGPEHFEDMENRDLETYDDSYERLTTDRRIELVREIEDAALGASDRVVSVTAFAHDSRGELVKVHSKGFEAGRRGTSYSAGLEVTVRDPNGGRPQEWVSYRVRRLSDLPSVVPAAKEAVDRALSKFGQTTIDSGVYEAVVENRVAARLLGALNRPMYGSALQQKQSFMDGKLGQKLFSDKLTWLDDPFIPRGLGSRTFDGDGLALKKRAIIDKGVLSDYYIDWYYSRKLGVEPTGGSPTNVVIRPGDRSLEEMIADMEKGILITGFIGGNSNSTTGDFSYGISGFYIEDGKRVKPIAEMNISGKLQDLWSNLVETGNDVWTYSSWRRPSLRFKDVHFSGV